MSGLIPVKIQGFLFAVQREKPQQERWALLAAREDRAILKPGCIIMVDQAQEPLADFLSFMSKRGLSSTSQRKVIAEAFFSYPGHHSLEEFYRHLAKTDPSIGQTTVYRTLKLLCEAGLANEIQFSDNITRFEVNKPRQHHDHMICLNCGKIIEICDPRIEALQKEIAEKHGFRLAGHSHNLYGYCETCTQEARDNN